MSSEITRLVRNVNDLQEAVASLSRINFENELIRVFLHELKDRDYHDLAILGFCGKRLLLDTRFARYLTRNR
jgi:hypothetical protein